MSKKTQSDETAKEKFFFPQAGTEVEAVDLADATAQEAELNPKQETDKDGQ